MNSRVSSVTTAIAHGVLLAAVPAALVHLGLPGLDLSSAGAVRSFIRQPMTSGFILGLAHAGAWGVWGLLATTVAVRGYHRLTRALRWLPALHLPGPLAHLAAVMLGATAVSAATGGLPAHASPPGPTAATSDDTAGPATTSSPRTTPPTKEAVGGTGRRATYTVARGDTLSTIAQRCLGDDDRWPEIFALNRGTHFPDVGRTLRDPDLIYPGWTLHLPADAAAPAGHQPRPPADAAPPASRPDTDTSPHAPVEVPSRPAASTPGPPQPPLPATPTASAAPDSSTEAVPAATTPAADTGRPAASDTNRPAKRASRGVWLPSGSWVDLGLAVAITAAVALVWAHRQRRYVPREPSTRPRVDDPALTPMPRVVRQIHRGLHRAAANRPDQPPHLRTVDPDADQRGIDDEQLHPGADSCAAGLDGSDLHDDVPAGGDQPPVVPALDSPISALWPPAGLGLTGPGAEAAARGFLTAALASGVERPDARVEVVTSSMTATRLLGAAAVTLPRTPRLTVTAGLDEALDILEAHTMHRTRLVDRHQVDTVAELRRADPYQEPLPPVMLLTHIAGSHERARVAALIAQGQRLDIYGVLLGEWPDGNTVAVAADGATIPADLDHVRHGAHPADVGRLAVLDPTETADLLTTLTESHTGQPQPPAPTQPAPLTAGPSCGSPAYGTTHKPQSPPNATDAAGENDTDTGNTNRGTAGSTGIAEHAARTASVPEADDPQGPGERAADDSSRADRVRVQVLGTPVVVDGDPQRTPRAKSLELLVYLAVHDGAASTEAILDDLLPDAPASKAPARLYTYVSGLRAVLRDAGEPGSYVTHPGDRYLLNRDLLDVDLWRMRAAIRDAAHAIDPQARAAALRRAVDAYTGPLADGRDYEWVEPYREAIRQEALDAHLALADALTGQPAQQLEVLDAAIGHNPHHEALYQAAMRARADLGDASGIRALRRTLTRRLSEIDAEPSDDTLALADRLVTDLHQHGRACSTRRQPHASGGAQ